MKHEELASVRQLSGRRCPGVVPVVFLVLLGLLSGCAGNQLRSAGVPDDLLQARREAAKFYQARDYQRALPLYRHLVEEVPDDALLWFRLGNLHARLQHPDQAIQAYRRTVGLNPALDKAWHNLSILHLRQAANSLTGMMQHIDPRSPLYPRAVRLSEGVIRLLEKSNEAVGH